MSSSVLIICGIAVMGLACIGGIVLAVLYHAHIKRLREQLQEEYGPEYE